VAEVEPYGKLLWGETAEHNKRAEWVRRIGRRKISNMDWGPIQITKKTPFL